MTKIEMQFMKGLKISNETIENNQLLLLSLQNDVRILVHEYYDSNPRAIDQNDFEFQYLIVLVYSSGFGYRDWETKYARRFVVITIKVDCSRLFRC